MSNLKWIVAASVLVVGVGVLVAHAAQPALNVKLGLWETHTQAKMSGDMSGMISEAQLQSMTPEQRAKMQAAMQQAMAAMQKPHYAKECMTAEKLAKGFDMGNGNCKSTVITNTASEFDTHMVCMRGGESQSMTVHVIATSPEHVTGVMKGDENSGSKGVSYSGTFEGKWLGSDCGAVKDRQEEPAPK
jgi:Spy/CpxP family protein refolding chaperone